MKVSVEILCTRCGAEAFLKREAVYDGLKKTGETLSCSACGSIFAGEEEVRFKESRAAPGLFTADDRTEPVKVFAEGENREICRYCADYVINPFMQFCSRHKKEVQATDSCPSFAPVSEKPAKPLF